MSDIFPSLLPETQKPDLLSGTSTLPYAGSSSGFSAEANLIPGGNGRAAEVTPFSGDIKGNTDKQLDMIQARSVTAEHLAARMASSVPTPSSDAIAGKAATSDISAPTAGSAAASLPWMNLPAASSGNTSTDLTTGLPKLQFLSNENALLLSSTRNDSAYNGVPIVNEDGSEVSQSATPSVHPVQFRSFAVYAPTPSAAYDHAVYGDASDAGMSPWGVGGVGGTIGGHGLTRGEAADLAVNVWELKSEEWITQILGVPLSPEVRKEYADVIHGAVKKHGESPAESIQSQRYNIASSEHGEQVRNAISREFYDRDLTPAEHKALAVKLAEGTKTLAQFRKEAAYSDAARHKIADIFKQEHGSDATQQDLDYGSMKTGDGWSLQEYRWNEAHSDRVASQLQNIITSVQGRPYQDSDAVWVRAKQDSLGTGQQNIEQIRRDLARWTADNGGYDAVFQATHDTAMQASDRNYAAEQIGNGWSVQEYRQNEAHSDRAWQEYGTLVRKLTGNEPNASQIREIQDKIGNGASYQSARSDLVYSPFGRQAVDKIFESLGIGQPDERQYSVFQDWYNQGRDSASIRAEAARGLEGRLATEAVFRSLGIGPPDARQYGVFQEWFANKKTPEQVRSMAALGLEGRLATEAVFRSLGIGPPDARQYGVFQEWFANKKTPEQVRSMAALGLEGRLATEAVFRSLGIGPPDARQYGVFQGWFAEGKSPAEIRSMAAQGYEGRLATEAVFRSLDIGPPDARQYGVFQEWFANKKTPEQVRSMAAQGYEGEQAVNKLYNGILNRSADPEGMRHYQNELAKGISVVDLRYELIHSPEGTTNIAKLGPDTIGQNLTEEEIKGYQNRMVSGKSLNDVRWELAHTQQAGNALNNLSYLISGKPVTEMEMIAQQEMLGTDVGWDALRKTQIYSIQACNYLASIHKDAFQTEITASVMAQYQDALVHHRDVYGEILEFITPKAPPTLQRDHWTYVKEDGPNGIIIDGYVPKQNHFVKDPKTGKMVNHPIPDSHSGVTIGHGIDLGQFLKSELKNMGIPDFLLKKLPDELFAPKSGSKGLLGQDAQDWLDTHELKISRYEGELISAKVYEHHANIIIDDYNARYKGGSFSKLNTNIQTVIVDLGFRMGPRYLRTDLGKNLADKINSGDLSGASDYIKSFGPSDNRYIDDAKKILEK